MSRSRIRPAPVVLVLLALMCCTLSLVVSPPGAVPPAGAVLAAEPPASDRVDDDTCRRIDPNLVNGACLRYRTPEGSGLTWIGTYRAPDGRVFFCIDFLYDSRLPRRAERVSTDDLVNQLGRRVGDAEVAALNHLISRWAADGSTGSDDRDAAIALIIREVMSDGRTPTGVTVYPGGLVVGERVQPPAGVLGGRVLRLARSMWQTSSAQRGPYRMTLRDTDDEPVRLGQVRRYRLSVISLTGRRVADIPVSYTCTGPIRCPRPSVTTAGAHAVRVRPLDVGRFRLVATASVPSIDGVLYRQRDWSTHSGRTARPAGVQRGWIAQENNVRAAVSAEARIRKGRPEVVTQTSAAVVTPGAQIHDVVKLSTMPQGFEIRVVASLYGPFEDRPRSGDCTAAKLAGRVRFTAAGNGTYLTPSVTVPSVGRYTWVEHLPGTIDTVPVTTRCGLVAETTRVEPFTPRVRTVVSKQRAFVGDAIHDTVVVDGLDENAATLAWTLHGPQSSRNGSCEGAVWNSAPVADEGVMEVIGDGTYETPASVLARAGCYTYAQRVLSTPISKEAVSPPGLVEETALVERRTPLVTTVVSSRRAEVGSRVHDSVRIRRLGPQDEITVEWRLHGPLAPASGASCRGLDWADAATADSGRFEARANGTRRTRSTEITRPGCYTYSERVAATASTRATSTEPGIPVETALVTRPTTPYVPEVPSGLVAATRRAPSGPLLVAADGGLSPFTPFLRARPRYLVRPYRAPEPVSARSARERGRDSVGGVLSIERLGLRAPVQSVGLDRGALAVPNDHARLGWLSTTAAAGDVLGSSVISGHVGPDAQHPGGLWRLKDARVGDVVTWREAGETYRFVVRGLQRFARTEGVPAALFRTDGRRQLHLITCTTPQGSRYRDNLVVTAVRL